MLRIRFTADDFASTRIAGIADPLWELQCSLRQAQIPYDTELLPLLREQVLAVRPADRPSWAALVLSACPELARQLEFWLQRAQRTLATASAEEVRTCLRWDRAHRARVLMESGTEGLLASFGPRLHWRDGVIEAACPGQPELLLGGRGIALVPSCFDIGMPVVMQHEEGSPMLVYVVPRRPVDAFERIVAEDDPLANLLGITRANTLRALASGRTTGELARDLALAPATVSRHTAVLREGGLAATTRHGGTAWHTVTALGARMLEANEASRPR
ncbi:ArsR/SmtB family transcription factor [Amycolatopsis magusensis]|uniref:ArsR/SmtB family transcription factor n=1 Tax=Amycolatopsis magusensis TaxID=882444 RepID=UPI003C30BE99